jgi:hypothetical protein
MSGIHQMLLAGGSPVNLGFHVDIVNTAATSGQRSAALVLNANGTTTVVPGGLVANWYLPTTAGIGGQYWARMTPVSPVNTTFFNNAPNVWIPINGTGWSMSNTDINGLATGSFTVEFSANSAGTAIVSRLVNAITWRIGKA